MTPIRAVLFDFGGVILNMPSADSIARLLRLFGIRDMGPFAMMNLSPTQSEFVMDVMTGRQSEQEVWDNLSATWRVHPRVLGLLRGSGFSKRRLNLVMYKYLASLRPRYKTAILTNAGTDFRGTFCRAFALETLVDQVIISAEEGLAKPDPRIFHLALERLGVQPEQAVFVDDVAENVEAAKQAGLQALVHSNNAVTLAWLGQLLGE